MRKLACTVALLAALPATAHAAVATKGTLESCHTGASPNQRYAVFASQMGTIAGAHRLQVRFDLLQRLPGGSFQPVTAPGLGVWSSSIKDAYRFRKTVLGLQAPASYRAVVRFRWLGEKGAVLKSATRTTRSCVQPDPGADLAVGAIKAQSAGSGRLRYLVTVRNDGLADAGAFNVALSIGDAAQPPDTVESLGAGARTVVTWVGARCTSGEPITVQVDPEGRIDQTDRTDDQKVVECPVADG